MNHSDVIAIRKHLEQEGFTDNELIDDLVDHLATEIEQIQADSGVAFEKAFSIAKEKLLPETPYQLETDLKLLTTQKHNIMIKKIAFIGGYLSTVCLCISLVLFFNSTFSEKKIENMEIALRAEHPEIPYNEFSTIYNEAYIEEHSKAYIQTSLSQTIFIISFILFAITFLPYQFYARYQRSEAALLTT